MKTTIKVAALLLITLFITSCNMENKEKMNEKELAAQSMEEQIRKTNESRFEAWNTADTELMLTNLSDNFERYTNGGLDVSEKSAYPSIMDFYLIAFPDLSFDYEILAIEGNKSFTQWIASGTNTGSFNGQPATGRTVLSQGFTVVTYDYTGKAMIEEAYVDNMGIFNSLGYTMVPPTAQ